MKSKLHVVIFFPRRQGSWPGRALRSDDRRARERSRSRDAKRRSSHARTGRDGRRLLVRDPELVHRHARHRQPEQRRRLAEPAHRHRSARALHLATGRRDGLHDVADTRAAVGNDSHRSRRDVWLRSRRDRDHAQRVRVARDSAHGNGLQTRRRDSHHDAGLSAHADHAAPARTSRRSRAEDGEDPDSAEEPQRDHRGVRTRNHESNETDSRCRTR